MRILVCGGRDYIDVAHVFSVLDAINGQRPITAVVHGAAKGADALADLWAQKRHVRVSAYPADWQKHGKSAGAMRNLRMLEEGRPDMVVAFPGGKGTAHMVKLAEERGTYVLQPQRTEVE